VVDLVVSADLLTRAARRNGYAVPNKGLLFFGIRGLTPEHPFDNTFASSHPGRFSAFDFRRMRCTLGQWNVGTGQVAIFPGSTVPSLPNITSSRARGGSGTNMLMLGRYEHERGTHKAGKPSGHRAFRQAAFFPVWRTADNLAFDLKDKIDFGTSSGSFVWDNIHSSYFDNPETGYSSAGCQVVCGLPSSPRRNGAKETGPWRTFVDNGYAGRQNRFVYLLFSAEELSSVEKVPDTALRQVVRFGSSGPLAEQVQHALVKTGDLSGRPDGEFGRLSLRALVTFQLREFGAGAADGVCGEITSAALGIDMPTVAAAAAAPLPKSVEVATDNNAELEDETDLQPDILNLVLAALNMPSAAASAGGGSVQPAASTPAISTVVAPAATTVVQPVASAGGTLVASATVQPVVATVAPQVTTVVVQPVFSSTNFERAQEIVREFEGGFSDDPKDPGGATNFGITKTTLERFRGRRVTKAEVANMSYGEAKRIYFAEYWSKSSCDAMPGPLALVVYNVCVHAGPGTAARFLQRGLRANGAMVDVDGGIGGETLGAVPKVPLSELLSDVIDLYEARLRAHKNFEHFKRGFLRRVNKLRIEAEKWLAEDGATMQPIPTPKLAEEGEQVVSEQVNDIVDVLRRILQSGTPTLQPQLTPIDSDLSSPSGSLAMLLRQIADRLDPRAMVVADTVGKISVPLAPKVAASTVLPPDSAKSLTLTPVNAALGEGIGKMLDGRKSGIGIIAATLSSLLMPTQQVAAAAGGAEAIKPVLSPLADLLPTVIGTAVSGAAPIALPLSLALTAWGFLGKLDKYARAK
jgi:lysozyme family protein